MRKIIIMLIIFLLHLLGHICCMAQESKSKERELTVYMRVKDHLTHEDVDSTILQRHSIIRFVTHCLEVQ